MTSLSAPAFSSAAVYNTQRWRSSLRCLHCANSRLQGCLSNFSARKRSLISFQINSNALSRIISCATSTASSSPSERNGDNAEREGSSDVGNDIRDLFAASRAEWDASSSSSTSTNEVTPIYEHSPPPSSSYSASSAQTHTENFFAKRRSPPPPPPPPPPPQPLAHGVVSLAGALARASMRILNELVIPFINALRLAWYDIKVRVHFVRAKRETDDPYFLDETELSEYAAVGIEEKQIQMPRWNDVADRVREWAHVQEDEDEYDREHEQERNVQFSEEERQLEALQKGARQSLRAANSAIRSLFARIL